MLRCRGLSRIEKRGRDTQGKSALSIEKHIHQRGERAAIRWTPIGPEPSRTPQVEHSCVTAERTPGRMKGGKRVFFCANDRRRLIALACELQPRLDRMS